MNKKTVTFCFSDRTMEIQASPEETILTAAKREGLPVLSDCEQGFCGVCKAVKTAGEVFVYSETPSGLSETDIAEGKILMCQTHAVSRSELKLDYPGNLAEVTAKDFDTKIKSINYVAADVIRLIVERPPFQLNFLPGQYANITLPEENITRAYSFSSSPGNTDQLEFLIRLLPDGKMSSYLCNSAKPGDTVTIKAPCGSFFLREDEAPLLFVAGGTGLGPFLSMLQHLHDSDHNDRKITLIYGVNDRSRELNSIELLDFLKEKLIHFDYQVSVANPDPGWQGKSGYVTELLTNEHLRNGAVEAYLCGPPKMIESGVEWLKEHGLQESRIHYEQFTSSSS